MNARRSLPLVLMVLLLAAIAGAQKTKPQQFSPYEDDAVAWTPSDSVALATIDGEAITELDLYVWELLIGRDPSVIEEWRVAVETGDTARLSFLDESIRLLLEARLLAEMPEADEDRKPGEEELATRILAAPAAKVVFAERLVRPEVKITSADVAYEYSRREEEFRRPARVEVVRLRVPIALPVTPDTRQAAIDEALRLRELGKQLGGLRPVLEQLPRYVMDEPAGSTRWFAKGQSDLDANVAAVLFRLSSHEISEPVASPSAILLYECVAAEKESAIPINEVRDELLASLRPRLLDQQVNFQLAKETKKRRPVARPELFPFMEDGVALVKVRDFEVTRFNLIRLFPEVVDDLEKPSPAIAAKVGAIVSGEVMTQAIEEAGLGNDPMYRKGLATARLIARGANALRVRRSRVQPSEEEVREFAEEHREELAPGSVARLWRLEARIERADRRPESELEFWRLRLQSLLREAADDAERQLHERSEIAGFLAYSTPAQVVTRLLRGDGENFKVSFDEIGDYDTARARRELEFNLGDYKRGEFTPPQVLANGRVTSYYIAQTREREPLPEAQLLGIARGYMVIQGARQSAVNTIADWEKAGRLKFSFPVPPRVPEAFPRLDRPTPPKKEAAGPSLPPAKADTTEPTGRPSKGY